MHVKAEVRILGGEQPTGIGLASITVMKKVYDTENKTPTPFELKEGAQLLICIPEYSVLLESGEFHELGAKLFYTVFSQLNQKDIIQSLRRFSKPVVTAHVKILHSYTRRDPYMIKTSKWERGTAHVHTTCHEPQDHEEYAQHLDDIRRTAKERLRPDLGLHYILNIVE